VQTTDALGEATTALPIPNDPQLVSGEVFAQYAVLDPGGALFGLGAVSDGLRIVLGD
jgi:hypothetical protein